MLFVSRYIGQNQYGVVDTDDNYEDIVTITELNEAARNGLHIEGFCPSSLSATPYTLPSEVTPQQVKLEMLAGVQVSHHYSLITCITFNNITSPPVTVRASDFGTSLGDYIFRRNRANERHMLTLLLDDKLCHVSELALTMNPLHYYEVGVQGVGVVFDLQEVKSPVLADAIYKSLAYDKGRPLTGVLDSVIDFADRKLFFRKKYWKD